MLAGSATFPKLHPTSRGCYQVRWRGWCRCPHRRRAKPQRRSSPAHTVQTVYLCPFLFLYRATSCINCHCQVGGSTNEVIVCRRVCRERHHVGASILSRCHRKVLKNRVLGASTKGFYLVRIARHRRPNRINNSPLVRRPLRRRDIWIDGAPGRSIGIESLEGRKPLVANGFGSCEERLRIGWIPNW